MLKSIEGNFDNPEVHELLTKHFIELRAASPEGSAHVLDIPGLKVPSIKFWSLWENDLLMGCGALKFLDKEHGEFKSIRIHDNFRRMGNGINVINHLINEAKKLNIKVIFAEESASTKTSQVIADEIGGKVLVLSPLETVSDEENYVSKMTQNLENLKEALC